MKFSQTFQTLGLRKMDIANAEQNECNIQMFG